MDLNSIHHLSSQKMKCSYFDFAFWWLAGLFNGLKPHPPPLSSQKIAHILIMFNFWWLARLVDGLKPHPPPLSTQKNEMLTLMISRAGSMDHPPPVSSQKMKCSILILLKMDSNPIHHPSPAKKWNAHILIMFNFWWSARLVNGLKPHPPPLCTQKNEMLIFGLRSTSDDQPGWSMDLNPIHHLSPAKKWNAHILILLNFWWLARLVNGLKPHPPPLSSQ